MFLHHSTKVISTIAILIFQTAHKRNHYISQKIFRPSHKKYPLCPSHKKYSLRLSHKKYSLWPSHKKYSISEYIIPLSISQEIPLDHLTRNIPSTLPTACGVDLGTNLGGQVFEALGQSEGLFQHGVERERTHTPHLMPVHRQHSPVLINISSLPHFPSPQDVHTSAPLLYQKPNLYMVIFICILHHQSIPVWLYYNEISL